MIPRMPFGATGHESSRVIFGAAALGSVTKTDADRAFDLLVQHGVNHIDVAASYGDAELRVATWLRRHPGEFFVATKTGERTYRGAREEIRRSLDRLGVDRIDSIQLHNLVDVIDWELAPYNYVQMQDPRYAETFEALAAVCAERGVALQPIKSLKLRRWEGRPKSAATWYEPLRDQADIDLAVHWVLGRPEAFLL